MPERICSNLHNRMRGEAPEVKVAWTAAPGAAASLAACAKFLESQGRATEALEAWTYALEIDPLIEAAHFGVAHILLDRGDFQGAAKAAEVGLRAAPKSARLYLEKALAEEKQERWYDARRTMAQGIAAVDDVRLLRHEAELDDQFGHSAARSYAALADALAGGRESTTDYLSVLERGREVSLRSGDLEEAGRFEARLKAAGHLESSLLPGDRRKDRDRGVRIPGGLKALLVAVQGNERTAPERFFVEYCRTILGVITSTNTKIAKAALEVVPRYFELVSAVEAHGKRDGDRVTVTLSTGDRQARKATAELLHLMGWEIRYSGNAIVVETCENGSAWRYLDNARALGIDQLAMQEALQAGGSFRFDVVDEWAQILFDEKAWRSRFYPKDNLPGGLAEAVALEPQLAKTYLGLSALDEDTASALTGTVDLTRLAGSFADLLYAYSSSLAVRNGRAVVPGGEQAEGIWERLAGAAPGNPGRFFEALLRKDEGRMLAYFFALTELDSRHQKFFTRSLHRAAEFYRVFKEAPDVKGGAARTWRDTPFIDFLAQVPLDGEGRVKFPGSPEVWTVANGQSNSNAAAGLLKRLSKPASYETEDEILLRLARTSYMVAGYQRSELSNFLAVVHLDTHRVKPLSGDAALLLAQEFDRFRAAWPYLTILTGLERSDYVRFFTLGEKLLRLDEVELNRVLGQVHSLLKLICMAKQAGRIDEGESTELFGLLCDRFLKAASAREQTMASLEIVRALMAHALPGRQCGDADACLEDILFGRAEEVSLELEGVVYRLNGGRARRDGYRRVLELQRVPALLPLLEINDTARVLAGAEGDLSEKIQTLAKSAAALPEANVPQSLKVFGKELESLRSYQVGHITDIIGRLRRLAAGTKHDPGEQERLAGELLGAINPQVELALSGIVYAYYLNPSDLLISEDPLFLRRHQFVDLDPATKKTTTFSPPHLVQRSIEGSYLGGGFADFAAPAGEAALAGLRTADAKSCPFIAMQIGLLRATRWDMLEDGDLRLLGLRIRTAREWVVRAALDPAVKADLAEAASGILSLTRRADLLRSLETRDWDSVWRDVTLSDLFFLSGEYLSRHTSHPWDSPAMRALQRLVKLDDGARLNWMGQVPGRLMDCGDVHLQRLPPYEHFEKFLLPGKLAERAAEFKLYVGEYLDRRGYPAAALEVIAEPLAMEILREVRLTDLRDWHAMLRAYAGIDDKLMRGVLAKR